MRRIELLIDNIRRQAQSLNISGNDGFSDLEIIQGLNDGQENLYARIVAEFPSSFESEALIDLVAAQEAYTMPTNLYLGTKLKTVEYLYGGNALNYYKLYAKTIHSRLTTYTSTVPYFYIRRNNQLLINPIPQVSLTAGLRLVYQRSLRTLDVRRGLISSVSKTSNTLNSITIGLSPTLSKDVSTVQAAADLLNRADYICIVDKDGVSVLDAIPIDKYDSTTGIITVHSGFTTAISAGTFTNCYIVAGKYSTTHSELSDNCERYLSQYATYKLLRRNSNQLESESQDKELHDMLDDILAVFGTADDDIHPLERDETW